jgi:hypothetical protein
MPVREYFPRVQAKFLDPVDELEGLELHGPA